MNSLPKTVTRQCRDCDFNLSPSVPEYSTLTTRLPSHPRVVEERELDCGETTNSRFSVSSVLIILFHIPSVCLIMTAVLQKLCLAACGLCGG